MTFFKGNQHKERFEDAILRTGKHDETKADPEYASALYILTGSVWNKIDHYVAHDSIDFEAILQDTDFSGGEQVMVLLAANLFNGSERVDPLQFMRLDENNFAIAITAQMIRREGYRIDCSACHKEMRHPCTHVENGIMKPYCSACYMSQFD